jgi:hypothetical protein
MLLSKSRWVSGSVLTLLILSCGCGDNGIVSDAQKPSRKDGASVYDFTASVADAGIRHNEGLAHLLSTFGFYQSYADTVQKAGAMLANLCGYFQSSQGWDSSALYTPSLRDSIAAMLNNNYAAAPLSWWDRTRNWGFVIQNVSSADLAFVDSARVIFSSPYAGMTKAQICEAIIQRTNVLITMYNSASWQEPAGGEMSGGLLNLLKGSASFWKDKDTLTMPDNPNPDGVQYLIAADCIGYIAGWASALWDDMHSPGGVRVSGQGRRIGQGLIWGASGSACAWLLVAHQFGIDYR